MNKIEKRTFSLPTEHIDFNGEKFNSSCHDSASEVVYAKPAAKTGSQF